MSSSPNIPVKTQTLEVDGASLHYEVRGQGPLLAMIGAPMDANAFTPIAELLATDYTVLTADPRGVQRSTVQDANQDSTPEIRAEDLSQLITAVDAGPAIVFGSSGGAVTSLALAQAHAEQLSTVIAHEPPLAELLENHEQILRETDATIAAYQSEGLLAGWKLFFAHASIEMPPGALEYMFGGERTTQQISDDNHFFLHEMKLSTHWQPDIARLSSVPINLIIGVGDDSAGQFCDRTCTALAKALNTEATHFPGGHTGFVEDPANFAVRLRSVLAEVRS